MSDLNQSSDEETGADSASDVTRRAVLNGAVGTGALALGAGVVSADGKGGQGFVDENAIVEGEPFEFTGVGPIWEVQKFDCNGKAGLPFPYWVINVDGTEYNLYTRDNQFDTDKTYRWKNDKECEDKEIDGETVSFKQVGFARGD